VRDRVDELEPNTYGGELSEQVKDQVGAAKAAAKAILDSGCVGDCDSEAFAVGLSGHANPEHKPAAGSTNDTVSVSVSQVNVAAVELFDKNKEAAERAAE
jgi:Zn-dependent membrane protease YugP